MALDRIRKQLVDNLGNLITPTNPLPIAAGIDTTNPLSLSFLIVAGPGTVAAGATSLSIANTGAAAGTVNGATLEPGEAPSWEAPVGKTLGAITYDASGTTFKITKVSA